MFQLKYHFREIIIYLILYLLNFIFIFYICLNYTHEIIFLILKPLIYYFNNFILTTIYQNIFLIFYMNIFLSFLFSLPLGFIYLFIYLLPGLNFFEIEFYLFVYLFIFFFFFFY